MAESITPRQESFIVTLLSCPSVREACKLSGVSERAAYRWVRENQAVIDEIRRRKRETVEQAGAVLIGHVALATACFAEVCGDRDAHPATRVSAAKAIWDTVLRLRDQDELETRLEEVEQALVAIRTGRQA